MRRSFTLGLTSLALLAGCAVGTIGPTETLPGTDTPPVTSGAGDAGAPTVEDSGGGGVTPHLGSDASTSPPPVPPRLPKTPAPPPTTRVTMTALRRRRTRGSSTETDSGGTEAVCKGYAPPDVTAACTACKTPPCQANGCYGGYWCEMSEELLLQGSAVRLQLVGAGSAPRRAR